MNDRDDPTGLSLSIQKDPLAISDLLDDQRKQLETAHFRYHQILVALRDMWGADVMRCDHDGLLAMIAEHRLAADAGTAARVQAGETLRENVGQLVDGLCLHFDSQRRDIAKRLMSLLNAYDKAVRSPAPVSQEDPQ